MRTLPDGLQAHLDGGATTLCWCWRLMPHGAAALGFTDHDRDLAFDGMTFEARSGFTASAIETSLGLAVDNLDVEGALQSDRLDAAALAAGAFDAAEVEIWLVNWADVAQRVLMRRGNVGEVTRSAIGFTAEIRGLAHRLAQPEGRVFQFGCDAALGDARCGVDLASPAYRGAGTVIAAYEPRRFLAGGLDGFAEGWFAGGLLHAGGRTAEVKAHRAAAGGSVIELWQALPSPLAVGDGFEITAGCDGQFATCRAKFANPVNFRGFPHMPGNDFVTYYPAAGDAGNDGESRRG